MTVNVEKKWNTSSVGLPQHLLLLRQGYIPFEVLPSVGVPILPLNGNPTNGSTSPNGIILDSMRGKAVELLDRSPS